MTGWGPSIAPLARAHLTESLDSDAIHALEATANGRPALSHAELHGALAKVRRSMRRTRPAPSLHAAAVEVDGVGIALAGPSGCGKSTLSVALCVERGWSIASDDSIWLDGLTARGYGSPVALRTGNRYFEAAQRLWYATLEPRLLVRPSDLGGTEAARPLTLSAVVLPQFGRNSRPSLEILDPADAFIALIPLVTSNLHPCGVRGIAHLAGRLPVFRSRYADSASGLRLSALAVEQALDYPVQDATFLDPCDIDEAGLPCHVTGVRFADSVVMWSGYRQVAVKIVGWYGGSLRKTDVYSTLESAGLTS